MKGAQKYGKLFKTGQYGKLYITSGSHARGRTFRIQVLPEGVEAIPNGPNNMCSNNNAVEVYGVIKGNLVWTEEYDWLHKGKWQDDFMKLVQEKENETYEEKKRKEELKQKQELEKETKIKSLLNNY